MCIVENDKMEIVKLSLTYQRIMFPGPSVSSTLQSYAKTWVEFTSRYNVMWQNC